MRWTHGTVVHNEATDRHGDQRRNDDRGLAGVLGYEDDAGERNGVSGPKHRGSTHNDVESDIVGTRCIGKESTDDRARGHQGNEQASDAATGDRYGGPDSPQRKDAEQHEHGMIRFDRPIDHRVARRQSQWLIRIALAAPLFWLLAAAFVTGSTSEAMDQPIFVVSLILILLISVPLTLRLLVDMSMPELTQTGSRRITASIVALVAVLGAIGFTVGREHARFLTCYDFSVAGASEPDNCVRQ